MTTQEIQQYIDAAIGANFEEFTSESGEMMTSEGGDGRFMGKVIATRYGGLPVGRDLFLAIGETDLKVQIVSWEVGVLVAGRGRSGCAVVEGAGD